MSKKPMLAAQTTGECSAFETLYRDYSRAVFRWSLFFGLSQSAAEEVTQDVFMTAFKKTEQFPEGTGMAAWLFQTTRKHAANYRRRSWFREMLWPVQVNTNQNNNHPHLEMVGEPQLTLELQQTLKRLPLKLTEVLILHDLDGLTQREIAKQLSIPEGTVASRLRKARHTFRVKWNPRD